MSNTAIDFVLPWTQAVATNLQTEFSTTWTADATTDVVVYARASADVPDDATQLISTNDYTVSFVGNDETVKVTFDTGRTTGDIVTIIRATPSDRMNLYTNTNFTPTMLNGDFNRLVMMLQQRLLEANVWPTNQFQLQPKYNNSVGSYVVTGDANDFQVPRDIIIPVLGASQIWQKNAANTAIVATIIPDNPTGSVGGDFTGTGFLVATDITDGNNLDQTLIKAPTNTPTVNQVLAVTNIDGGTGVITTEFTNAGSGDVVGPAGATDNAYARYNSATGKLIQNSQTTEDDSGNVTLVGSITIPNAPSATTDGTNKAYVDARATGSEWKDSAVAATTAALTVTYNNGTAGIGATLTNAGAQAALTIDGVALSANDRVLVKDQAAAAQNGIYTVTIVGDGSSNWVLTRATDHDEPSEMEAGVALSVDTGTVNAATLWLQTSTVVTVGTTAVDFTTFGSSGDVVGPATAVDKTIPRYDGTTGKLIQGSGVTIDDANKLSAVDLNASSLTASRAVVTDGSKNLASSATTATEIGYVNGATSNIQDQINAIQTSAANPNLILNPTCNTVQRGTSFTAATSPANNDGTYCFDRFVLLSDGNDIVDLSQATGAANVPTFVNAAFGFEVATANKKFGHFQILGTSQSNQTLGRSVSLSFEAKIGSSNATLKTLRVGILTTDTAVASVPKDCVSAWNGAGSDPTLVADWNYENVPADITLTDSYVRYTIENIDLNLANATLAGVFFWINDVDATVADELFIGKVQLEVGATTTEYQQQSAYLDVLLCKEYFTKLAMLASTSAWTAILNSVAVLPMRVIAGFISVSTELTSGTGGTFIVNGGGPEQILFNIIQNGGNSVSTSAIVSLDAEIGV